MRKALLLLAAIACKHAPPPEPDPPRLVVFGEVTHACTTGIAPAAGMQVDLRDREEPNLLGTTVTSSVGRFRIETEPLGFEGGRFELELGAEGKVPVSGSTRLQYRVIVRLPCPDPAEQAGPAGVISEVWPQEGD